MDDNYFLGRLRDLVTFHGLRLNYLSHVFCHNRPRFFDNNVYKVKLTPPATCPVPPYAEYDPASTFVISGFICATNRFHVYKRDRMISRIDVSTYRRVDVHKQRYLLAHRIDVWTYTSNDIYLPTVSTSGRTQAAIFTCPPYRRVDVHKQ